MSATFLNHSLDTSKEIRCELAALGRKRYELLIIIFFDRAEIFFTAFLASQYSKTAIKKCLSVCLSACLSVCLSADGGHIDWGPIV